MRLLFLLDRAGEPCTGGAPPGAYRLMRGQTRLQALDFWVRNPDYLADELITEYEADTSATWALEAAREIFTSREPAIRRLPMLKWRFGAYEPLDDTLAIMISRRLVVDVPTRAAPACASTCTGSRTPDTTSPSSSWPPTRFSPGRRAREPGCPSRRQRGR